MDITDEEWAKIREYSEDFVKYQRYRNSDEVNASQELDVYEKGMAYLLHLNALRKKLSNLQWKCEECKGCSVSGCPNTLVITLHAPELWMQWQLLSRERMKYLEAFYKKAQYTVTLNAIGSTLLTSGFQGQQMQNVENIVRDAHQLYHDVMPEFFKVLDDNTPVLADQTPPQTQNESNCGGVSVSTSTVAAFSQR